VKWTTTTAIVEKNCQEVFLNDLTKNLDQYFIFFVIFLVFQKRSSFFWVESFINYWFKLEKLLDNVASDIRFEIQQYALLGNIPRVVFVKG